MLHQRMSSAVFVVALTLSTTAIAQQAQFGTAAEAKARLKRAVAGVKAEKAQALGMFNKGEGGLKDRDLQPFCFNVSDGKITAATVPKSIEKIKPLFTRAHPPASPRFAPV